MAEQPTSKPPASKSQNLLQWIWRAFFRTALTPLLLVEVVLILAYIASNNLVRNENLAAIRTVAAEEVTDIASRQAILLDLDLRHVHSSIDVLTDAVTRAMTAPLELTPEERARALSRYVQGPGEPLHLAKDEGGSALYYSTRTKIGEAEQDKVLKTERFDPLMRVLVRSNPLWVQAYLNTHDSLNRIYPFFDVLKVYSPDMDVPSYNFYYEADAKHNPERKVVWTDVYVDPAGQGWMASCIAPVYNGDTLEGVVGADITVATLVKKVLDLKIPWDGYGMLIGRSGTILALPEGGERDFNLVELTNHDYQSAILKDTFKPDGFNLFKRGDLGELPRAIETQHEGILLSSLRGQPNHVAWSTIEETGWKLMVVVPRAKIDEQAISLSQRMGKLAVTEVGGDYYDVLSNKDKLWITIGDVSSHGLGAGLVMMVAQSVVQSVFEVGSDLTGDEVLRRVNRILHAQICRGLGRDHYVTGQIFLHRGGGAFDCVGGHLSPIVFNAESKQAKLVDIVGPWLGIVPKLPKVPVTRLNLSKDEVLVLYSDGITEAKNDAGEEYGVDRLTRDVIEILSHQPSLDTCAQELLGRVATFSNKRDDDRTILFVRYRGD